MWPRKPGDDAEAVAVSRLAEVTLAGLDLQGLHAGEGLGAGEPSAREAPLLDLGVDVAGHLVRRAHDPPGGGQEAESRVVLGVRIGKRRGLRAGLALLVGNEVIGVAEGGGHVEGRSRHSERVEHPLLDVAVERDPRSLLDDVPQHSPRRVVVEEVLAGSEGDLVLGAVHEPVEVGRAAHRDAGVAPEAPRDEDRRGPEVREARAVGEQVADRDGLAGSAQLERHVEGHRVVQPQLSLLGELEDGDRDEALRHAADAVERVGRGRQVLLGIPRAESRRVDRSAVLHHGDAEAREARLPHHLGHVRVEPRPDPGHVGRLLRRGRDRAAEEKGGRQQEPEA